MTPRLFEKYNKEIIASLTKKLGKTNIHSVPKLEKIVVNMGVGSAIQDKKYLEEALDVLTIITGQKPIVTTAFTTVRNQIEDGVTGSIAQIDAADIAEKLRALLTDLALRQKYADALRDYAGNMQELEKWEEIW